MKKLLNSRFKYLLFLLFSIIVFSIIFSITITISNQFMQSKQIKISEEYLIIQSKLENIIYEAITITNGLDAFITTSDNIENTEHTYAFLEKLFSSNYDYIRNIAILKDTTILINFPYKENKETIGLDLSSIEKQREIILQVKNYNKNMFQGPVNLIQGDNAFIYRTPFDYNRNYWGQIATAIDANKVYATLDDITSNLNINIQITDKFSINNDQAFYKNNSFFEDNNNLIFILKNDVLNWEILIQPKDGWPCNIDYLVILFNIVFSIFAGFKLYNYYQNSNKTRIQANHDNLTKLYNRNFLEKFSKNIFKKAIINNSKIGLVMLDINNFKTINDTYGHKVGDLVLIHFANSINDILRTNQNAFRIGGDEFLILVSDISKKEDLSEITTRIKQSISSEFNHNNINLNISASIGYSVFPDDGESFEKALIVADKYMYIHKEKHKKNNL